MHGPIPVLRSCSTMKNTHSSPSKLAILSHHKLEQEISAGEPDLRRCLGHNAVFSNSMSVTRKNVASYRKSFRLQEDDMDSHDIKKKEKDDKGSPVRAQIAKTVKAMVRRRSSPALPITTTTTATATATPTANTTIPKDNELVRMPANETEMARNDNHRMTTASPSTRKSLFSTKTRHCAARLVTGRKFWMHSMMVQATAG